MNLASARIGVGSVMGVVLALAAPAMAAEPSPAPSPMGAEESNASLEPGVPWIVFQQFTGRSTVTLVRGDGTGRYSPTDAVAGGDQSNPDWSPDGTRLVFARASGGHEDLWVVDADGMDAHQLAGCQDDCAYLDDPDWAPDGDHVVFSRMRIGADGSAISTLEQVDVVTGESSVIVQAEPGHFYAGQRLSPDGRSLVLEVVELAADAADSDVVDVSLAVIDLADPTPAGRELIGSGRFPETAAWAPDGELIVFGALDAPGGRGPDLYAINPDGDGLRRLTTLSADGGSATHPDVSGDGRSIVFTAVLPDSDAPVLARVDIEGGEVVAATGATFIAGVHPRQRPIDGAR